MEETDSKILLELLKDGRANISGIAEKVGLSRQTTSKKIDELEDKDIIRSFTAELDCKRVGLEKRAYIIITAAPQKELREKFIEEVKKIKEIRQIHYIFGRFDVILEVITTNEERLNEVIDHIHEFDAVKETETLICRDVAKKETKDPFIKALEG